MQNYHDEHHGIRRRVSAADIGAELWTWRHGMRNEQNEDADQQALGQNPENKL